MSPERSKQTRTGVVFGGSGFIGQHLLNTITTRCWHAKVYSVDVLPAKSRLPGVSYIEADLREPISLSVEPGESTIYNLTGVRTFPGHPDWEYYDTNILTAQRALDFAEAHAVKKIVFTSTMSVYSPGDTPRTESSPTNPVSPYGRSKLIGEVLHQGWLARNPSAQLIICRPAVIFGAGDNGNFTRLARSLECGYFVYVGRRDTIKSCGYVGDLVDSFRFALDTDQRFLVYNFAYPQRYIIQDIVEAFCRVAGYRAPRLTAPPALLNAAALGFETLNAVGVKNPVHRERVKKLFESTNIVPEWLVKNGFPYGTDLESALRTWWSACGGRFA